MTGPREWRHAEDCYASQHFDSGIRRKCTCGLSLLRDALDQGHRVVVGPEGVEAQTAPDSERPEGGGLTDAQKWWLAVIEVATEKEWTWTGEADPDPLLIVDRVADTVAQVLAAFPRLVPIADQPTEEEP